jgi:tetratricopeptide (TPR) repeat protein
MRGRAGLAGLGAGMSVLAMLASSCTSSDKEKSAPPNDQSMRRPTDGRALRPVSLPDVSRMTESVQAQMHERYSTLVQKMENPGASIVDLSDAYGEMGNLLMAAKYLDAAEPCYLNAQALSGRDRRWPYYLGHLYRTKGALAKSAAFFEQARRLRPDDEATLVWLGNVYLAQGQPDSAEPLLVKALSLQPRSVAALSGLGRAALARKDYVAAVKHLEAALALDPQAASIHYPLAMAYRELGESAKAEAHLRARQADNVEIAPSDPLMAELDALLQSPLSYEVQGTQALDRKDWTGAAAYFRKGVSLAPADPALRHRLGTALFLMGDGQGAQAEFEEALRVSPQYAKAHYSLGVLMASSGRDKEAIERFSAAVRYEPSYVEARLKLAAILRRTGRVQESLSQYGQVIEIDPRVVDASFGYAMALVLLGRYQEACNRLTDGMKAYPDQPGFAHALARLLAAAPDARVRDGRRAMAVMQTLSDQQQHMDLGETMAMTLAELGQYEQAAAWQRGAIAAATRTGHSDLAQRMAENLNRYEGRRPCRTPWRDGEMP